MAGHDRPERRLRRRVVLIQETIQQFLVAQRLEPVVDDRRLRVRMRERVRADQFELSR